MNARAEDAGATGLAGQIDAQRVGREQHRVAGLAGRASAPAPGRACAGCGRLRPRPARPARSWRRATCGAAAPTGPGRTRGRARRQPPSQPASPRDPPRTARRRVGAARRGGATPIADAPDVPAHVVRFDPGDGEDARPQPRRRIDLRDDAAERAGGVLELHAPPPRARHRRPSPSPARPAPRRRGRRARAGSPARAAVPGRRRSRCASQERVLHLHQPQPDARLDRPERHVQPLRHLDVRQPLEKRQLDRHPLDQRQPCRALPSAGRRARSSARPAPGPSAASAIRPKA